MWQTRRLVRGLSAVQILETQAALARAQSEQEAPTRADTCGEPGVL